MNALRVAGLLVVTALAGCGKNPLAPPGYVSFGVEASPPRGAANAISRSGTDFTVSVIVQSFSVTIERIDVSETGTDWQTILNIPATMFVEGENVAVTISSVTPLRPGEYHGVRTWFGKRFVVTTRTRPPNTVWEPNTDALEDFDRSNPRTFTTRDGGLAFPFTVVPGQDQSVVFSFDFSHALTNPLYSSKIFLDRDPQYYPKVTVRVSKFKG